MHVLLPQHYGVTIALLNCHRGQSTTCWVSFHLLHCNIIRLLLPESFLVLSSVKGWFWLLYNFRACGSHKNPVSDFSKSWALIVAQKSPLKRNTVPFRRSLFSWHSSDLQNITKNTRELVQQLLFWKTGVWKTVYDVTKRPREKFGDV